MKHGPGKWLSPCVCSRCQAIVSANVRVDPPKCPKFRGTSVVLPVDPDHGWGSRRCIPELPGVGTADRGELRPPEAPQAADAVPVCRAVGLSRGRAVSQARSPLCLPRSEKPCEAQTRAAGLPAAALTCPDRGGNSQILTFSIPGNENGPGRLRPSVPIPPCTATRASRLVPPPQPGQNGRRPTSLRLTWRRTFALPGAVGAGRSLTMMGPSTLPL